MGGDGWRWEGGEWRWEGGADWSEGWERESWWRLWVELGSGRGQGRVEMAEREGRDGKGMGEEGGEGDRWK